ncbi:MAG: chemotaxis protein CheW [Cellvibrionales bacterium]|nr:chemotaxis protein CheW [Cellvibrionales bacterium]
MMNATETETSNTQTANAQAVRDIPSMLLPVQDKQLLLPGVSVAEIVNFSYPECPENAPAWFLGYIQWRQMAVPLLSFEMLNQQTPEHYSGVRRIAVLNNTGLDESIPFIAIVLQGIPRLLRILPQDLSEVTDMELGAAEMAAMNTSMGETVLLPDISVLEQAYSDYVRTR